MEARGVADRAKPKRGAKAMRGKRGSNELHKWGSMMNEGKNPKEGGQEEGGGGSVTPLGRSHQGGGEGGRCIPR